MENISKAINCVMQEVGGLGKSLVVGSGNNSYKGVSAAECYDTIRKSMINNGLSIVPTGVKSNIKVDRWEEEVYNKYTKSKDLKSKQSVFTETNTLYKLLHISGESIDLAGYGQGVDTQDKGAGKATTYALKNTLINMFLVPTGDMYDTDNTHSDELDIPSVYDKPKITKVQFKEIAKHMNESGLEVARLFITESVMQEFSIPSYVHDKLKDLSDTYKENQNISDDDIDRIWKYEA